MNTGKIIAYNHKTGRGILESRLEEFPYHYPYHFLTSAVTFNESALLRPGVQVFWEVEEGSRRAHFVEIMSTSLTRFKNKLLLEGSTALD